MIFNRRGIRYLCINLRFLYPITNPSDSRKYIPVDGQKVYLTHLSKMVQPPQEELDRTLPDPLRAAYDGLEVVFR